MQTLGYKHFNKRQAQLKLLVSGTILLYLFYKANLRSISTTVASAQFIYYILAVTVYIMVQPLRTIRWGILLKEKHIYLSQITLLGLYFVGMFFSSFLPTIGGDVIRGYYAGRASRSYDISFASVITERLCGLFMIVLIGCATSMCFVAAGEASTVIIVSMAGSFAVLFGIVLLFCSPLVSALSGALHVLKGWSILNRIQEIYVAMLSYKSHPMALIWCALLSLAFELAIILIHYLLSLSLAWNVPFSVFLYAVPLITIITMIPVSFGGIGVREGAAVIFFAPYGITAASAITLSLLSYSITLIAGAVGGIIYPFYRTNR